MKKFIASILCVLMVLTSMSFAVSAIEVKTDREINIYVDDNDLVYKEAGNDTVTVTVKIEKNSELANAKYVLTYDETLFDLQEDDKDPEADGTISEMFYREVGTFTDGEILATYTFKAIPRDADASGSFAMSEAYTYTYIESIEHENFMAKTNSETVNVTLNTYEVAVKFDGNDVTGDKVELDYDDGTHTFEVTTVPPATVSYEVKYTDSDNNVTTTNPTTIGDLKAEGTYEITYTVTPESGYDKVVETITVVIKKPVYEIEVVENYVFHQTLGKDLVLVYTQTPNVGFNFDGNVMVDVGESGYEYNGKPYTYVYGFVTNPVGTGSVDEYAAKVEHWYDDEYEIPAVGQYDTDLNYDGTTDMQDITVAFGVANGFDGYFTNVKYQKNLLKADVSKNKTVRGEDTGAVTGAVK